jgi:hypothetical protein
VPLGPGLLRLVRRARPAFCLLFTHLTDGSVSGVVPRIEAASRPQQVAKRCVTTGTDEYMNDQLSGHFRSFGQAIRSWCRGLLTLVSQVRILPGPRSERRSKECFPAPKRPRGEPQAASSAPASPLDLSTRPSGPRFQRRGTQQLTKHTGQRSFAPLFASLIPDYALNQDPDLPPWLEGSERLCRREAWWPKSATFPDDAA